MNHVKRYEPWSVLNQLHSSLNDLFETPVMSDNSKIATGQWVPAVDIKENQQEFLLKADLPGVDPNQIEVTMEDGVLTIRGEKYTEKKEEGENYYRLERTEGSFYRRFSLPDTADADNIKANCKHGVLTVHIGKKDKAKPRRIDIHHES